MKTTTIQHTQGPWIAESAKDFSPGRHDDNRWVVNLGGMPLIAVVEQYRGEAEANARLIASAPDMLQTLREAEAWTAGDVDAWQHLDADTINARLATLRLAIQRATEGQT